jgi:hypothetical protein
MMFIPINRPIGPIDCLFPTTQAADERHLVTGKVMRRLPGPFANKAELAVSIQMI